MASATLGDSVEIPTIDGKRITVAIPAGTQNGEQIKKKGKGMSVLRRSIFGDLYIEIQVETPVHLTKAQKELMEKFAKTEGKTKSKTSPQSQGFFDKMKEMWDDVTG